MVAYTFVFHVFEADNNSNLIIQVKEMKKLEPCAWKLAQVIVGIDKMSCHRHSRIATTMKKAEMVVYHWQGACKGVAEATAIYKQ